MDVHRKQQLEMKQQLLFMDQIRENSAPSHSSSIIKEQSMLKNMKIISKSLELQLALTQMARQSCSVEGAQSHPDGQESAEEREGMSEFMKSIKKEKGMVHVFISLSKRICLDCSEASDCFQESCCAENSAIIGHEALEAAEALRNKGMRFSSFSIHDVCSCVCVASWHCNHCIAGAFFMAKVAISQCREAYDKSGLSNIPNTQTLMHTHTHTSTQITRTLDTRAVQGCWRSWRRT
jgi:hypothetical protein